MRVGRIESIVPDKDVLLARLDNAEDLDGIKAVVAELIETVGTYVFGYNERTGEKVLGLLALGGGGNVFFSNTDEKGVVINRIRREQILPEPDKVSETVAKRSESARAQRVTVGKKE